MLQDRVQTTNNPERRHYVGYPRLLTWQLKVLGSITRHKPCFSPSCRRRRPWDHHCPVHCRDTSHSPRRLCSTPPQAAERYPSSLTRWASMLVRSALTGCSRTDVGTAAVCLPTPRPRGMAAAPGPRASAVAGHASAAPPSIAD